MDQRASIFGFLSHLVALLLVLFKFLLEAQLVVQRLDIGNLIRGKGFGVCNSGSGVSCLGDGAWGLGSGSLVQSLRGGAKFSVQRAQGLGTLASSHWP